MKKISLQTFKKLQEVLWEKTLEDMWALTQKHLKEVELLDSY